MSKVFTGNISDLVTEEEYQASKPTIGKELKKGIGRGIDLLQANAYGALAAHADAAKASTVRDWAEQGQQSNMQEAAQNPAAEPSFTGLGKAYTDGGIANGIGRTGLWAAGAVGELAPQGAAAMASGAIGKRLGGGAGSAGLMMANNVAQETGSIYGDILEKTGKREGATAIEYGIPAALIDTAVEAVPVGKVLGSGLGSGSVIKDAAKAGVKQLVTEAPTEAIQTGIERAAVTSVDPDQQTFTPEGWREIIDSAAAGGIGGAVSGAGAEGIGRGLQTLTQNRQEQGVAGGQQEEVLPVAPQAFNPSPQIQTDPIARHVDNQVQAAASVDPSGGPLSKAVSTGVETGAVAIEAVKQAASDPAIQAKNLREIQNEIQANQEAKQAIETGQALLDAQEQLPAGDRAEGPDTQVAVSTNESRNVFGLSPADQESVLSREAKKLARVRAAYSDPATLAMAQNAKTETARLSDQENKDAELNKVRAKVDGRLNLPEFQDQLVRMADNAGWEEVGGRVIMRDLEGNGRMTAVGRTPWAPKEEWFVGGLGSKEQIQTAVRKAINGEKLGDKQRQIVEYMLDFAGENIITTAQRNYEYDQFFEKHDINGHGNMTEAEMDEFFNSPEFMQPMSILSGAGMPEEGKALNPEQEALVEFAQDHARDPDVADAIAVFASSASQLSGMDGSPDTISKAFEAIAGGNSERQQQNQSISTTAQGESTGGTGGGVEGGQEAQGAGILQSYTSEEIAAKEKAAADAESKAAQDAAKAEQKARADAERGDFQLTGSDRPADVAAAAGQNDLFGAGSSKKTNSPEISSSQQSSFPETSGEKESQSDGTGSKGASSVTYWADRASDLHDVAVVLRDKIGEQPNSDGAVAEISHEMVKFQLMTMDHSRGRRPTSEQFKEVAEALEAAISKYTGGQDIDVLVEKYGAFGTKAIDGSVKQEDKQIAGSSNPTKRKNVFAEAKEKRELEKSGSVTTGNASTAPEHANMEENSGVSVVDAVGASGPAVISQNTKDRPMREQRLIASGEQLYSATGRKIALAPKIDTSSKLKLAGSMKRMNQWLYDEAMKEAVETGSDWNQTLIKGIQVKNLSQSDQDTLNQILFGDADGVSDKNRVTGNGQPVDPRGKSKLKDISAGRQEEADHIPDAGKKVTKELPAITKRSNTRPKKASDAISVIKGILNGDDRVSEDKAGYDGENKKTDDLTSEQRAKLGQAALQLAEYYFDSGLTKFSDFARQMLNDIGTDKIKPFIEAAYMGGRANLRQTNRDLYAGTDKPDTVEALVDSGLLDDLKGRDVIGDQDENPDNFETPKEELVSKPVFEKKADEAPEMSALRKELADVMQQIDYAVPAKYKGFEGNEKHAPKELREKAESIRQKIRAATEKAEKDKADGRIDIFASEDSQAVNGKPETIQDFGEKIGGARKDMEIKSGTKASKKASDTRPAWERRFEIVEVAASNRPEEVGRWFIYDTKKKDWMGNPVRVGSREGFASKETAEKALPLVAVSAKHRVVPSREEGKYEIWRDVNDRKRVKVVDMLFDSREDAMRYMAGHAIEIIETNTTFGEADLPRPQYKNRTGIDRRDRDVKDAAFSEVFGFRGVEFGNWNNQADRQELLNDAYDGLLDLAEVMGIPPKAISLNGELALAFGARGHGLSGARAHYERDRVVINLTKENGAGSLAHEWFHAIDHYFARQDGSASAEWVTHSDGTRTLKASSSVGQDFASHGTRGSRSGMREELRKIYAELMTTISKKAEVYVEDTARADNFVGRARKEVKDRLDRIRADLSEQKDPKYWKRKNSPATTEQLSEFDMLSDKIIAGEFLETTYQDKSDGKKPKRRGYSLAGMRHTNDALERINAIMKEVRGRQGFTADGKGELDYLRETMRHYSQRIKQLNDAQTGTENTKFTATQFAMDARELDQGRGGDYWTTPHEMAARAFQGYVEDNLAARGMKTPFLNYAPENYGILTPWGAKRPFPHGEERKAINKVFDKFVSSIKTRETGTGLAIEEPSDGYGSEDRRFYSANELLRKEYLETEKAYGGEEAYQKAKDAGKTRLNYRQWVHVRTPRFKAWFGDWEGNPEGASKVVDSETGEPLVVYHGTDVDFSAFDKSKIKSRFPYSFGFHFTDRVSEADAYSSGIDQKNMMPGGITIPVFISAKNPLTIKTEYLTASMEADLNRAEIISKLVESNRDGNPYDAVIISRDRGDEWDGRNVVVFNSTQIKSSIGNSGDYGRDTGNIVSERKRQADLFRKRPGKTKGRLGEDVQADLFDDSAPKEIAPVQARENFFVRYQSVPVGQLRVGIKTISGPEDAAHAVSSIRKHAQETMMAIVVNKGGDILSVIRHSKGIKDASNVSPIELVAAAVNVPDAAGVWLAHNHPSGIVDPSESDERITKKIVSVAEGTGVQVLGHVIVGHGNDAAAFDALDTKNQYKFKIKPMVRRYSVDVTERVIRKALPAVKDRVSIDSPATARSLVEMIEPKNAVILLNTQHHHVGTLAMTQGEMARLRDGVQVDRLMKAIDTTNAAKIIIKAENESGILNTGNFFDNATVRVLDAFVVDKNNKVVKEFSGEVPTNGIFHRRTSDGVRKTGIDRQEAMKVINEFRAKYKGLSDLRFSVFDTKEQAYGKDALKRANLENQKITGGYGNGGMHVILEDIADSDELLATLRHEAWAHYGFDLIPPLRKRSVLSKLSEDIKGNAELNGIYEKIRRQYRKDDGSLPPEHVIMEEVVASIAEQYGNRIDSLSMEDGLKSIVRKIIDAIAGLLRSVGMIGPKDGVSEVIDHLVGRARYMRDGGKSIYDNSGTGFESRNGRQSWYYSALKEAAADMKQEKGSPEQMLAMLSRVPGVKPAEIEATGLKEFMQLQGKSVTKQQIMDYLQGNGVQVQETVLGEGTKTENDKRVNALQDEIWNTYGYSVSTDPGDVGEIYDNEGDLADYMDLPEGAQKIVDEIAWLHDDDGNLIGSGSTKFGRFVLPGGENYRELLLTLPDMSTPKTNKLEVINNGPIGRGWILGIKDADTGEIVVEPQATPYPPDQFIEKYYSGDRKVIRMDTSRNFQSSHFDQPNILAHIRFNERTDAEGKRVLFIEELQSDWAQKGRKDGFASDDSVNLNNALKEYESLMIRMSNVGLGRLSAQERSRINELRPIVSGQGSSSNVVPSAPFVTSTDAWVSLAMKRMISYAAENGFDRVAWTTGDQQAGRYDLSKQVDSIEVFKNDDGTFEIVAWKGGSRIEEYSEVKESQLEGYFGKDLAKKIIAEEGEYHKLNGYRSYKGNDLKVGGEGMKSFYDKIVPKVAKEIAKKMGGKVTSIEFDGRDAESKYVMDAMDPSLPFDEEQEVIVRDRRTMDGVADFTSIQEAENWLDKNDVMIGAMEQPGFDITPEMRSAVESGLPLFRIGEVSVQAEQSPLFKTRTADQVGAISKEKADEALRVDATAQKILAKGNKINDGDLVGVRLNINVLNRTGVPVQSIHKGGEGIRKKMDKPGNQSGFYNGEVLTYLPVATLKNAYFTVHQPMREKIASGSSSKTPMASADGEWINTDSPSFDGVIARFNPHGEHLFIDQKGRAVKWAEEATIMGHRAYLRGKIEYYKPGEAPEKAGDSATNATFYDPQQPPEQLDDLFFRRVSEGDASAVDVLKTHIQDRLQPSLNTFNWWHKSVGTQFHKAWKDRDYKKVFDKAQNYLNDTSRFAMESADLAPGLLPKVDSFADIMNSTGASRADIEKIADSIYTGTLDDQKVYTNQELSEKFGLNDRQRALYREFRKAINHSLDSMVASEIAKEIKDDPDLHGLVMMAKYRPERALDQVIDVLDARAEELESIVKQMEDGKAPAAEVKPYKIAATEARKTLQSVRDKLERLAKMKNDGYAPLMRFGKYTVTVTNNLGEIEYFGMFEKQSDARAMERSMSEEYGIDAQVSVGVMSQEAYKLYAGMSPDTLELFGSSIGFDKSQSDIFQDYLRMSRNNRSALKRLIRRKGTAGFSKDVTRSLASFITSNARQASGNWHLGEMDETIEQIRLNKKEKGDVIDEAIRLRDYLRNPKDEAASIRNLLFINYIGGSLASALTNMTQPITMTGPYLAQFGSATKHLLAAQKIGFGSKAEGDLGRAMERATDEGTLAPHEVYQLHSEAIRNLGSNILVRKFITAWGRPFALAEAYNRRLTFAAAYNMAKENPVILKQARAASPYSFAVKAVQETQGIYNKGNRPNWARGSLGATVFTFKQYSISYLEFLQRLPRKQQLQAIGILFLLAGINGLPFGDDIEDLIDTIAQMMGYNLHARSKLRDLAIDALGETAGDFIVNGASSLPGSPIDVQARMSLGNLIPGTGILKRSTTDKTRDVAEAVGPIGGMAMSIGQGIGSLMQGDIGTAVMAAAPNAVKNAALGAKIAMTGEYRDQGGRLIAKDVGAMDGVWKAIGFSPSSIAKESREVSGERQRIALARDVEAKIADRWAEAIVEQDADKLSESKMALADWNEKNPDTPIRITLPQIRQRVKAMGMNRRQRLIKSTPKELRGMFQ